jgi:hypothetical protein
MHRVADFTAAILAVSCVALLAGGAQAAFVDSFESYPIGSFPSPEWLEAGPFDNASIILETTDPAGQPTQALAIRDYIAPGQGIRRWIDLEPVYVVRALVRVDAFCDAPDTEDRAVEIGVGQFGSAPLVDVPQCGIYASSATHGWRLHVLGTAGAGADVDLELAVDPGRWYLLALDLDAVAGTVRSRILDALTLDLLRDRVETIAGWTVDDGLYDSLLGFDVEIGAQNTTGNAAMIDDVTLGIEHIAVPGEAAPTPFAPGLRVAPNPAGDASVVVWNLESTAAASIVALTLYDVGGRRVRSCVVPSNAGTQLGWQALIGSRPLAAGVYFLRLGIETGATSAPAAPPATRIVVLP